MKIEEIIKVFKRAKEHIQFYPTEKSGEEFIERMEIIEYCGLALDALSRLRPTTITDDPATWPPNGEAVYARTDWGDNKLFLCHETKTWWRDSEPYKPLQRDDAWQYLPEWEG
jgi:hypothetical protein